jgi:hypothetical protein
MEEINVGIPRSHCQILHVVIDDVIIEVASVI